MQDDIDVPSFFIHEVLGQPDTIKKYLLGFDIDFPISLVGFLIAKPCTDKTWGVHCPFPFGNYNNYNQHVHSCERCESDCYRVL